MLALTGGGDSAMMMAGAFAPPFSLFLSGEKEKTGRARSKREKDAGAEFDHRGQIRPRYGGWSEPVPIRLANFLPAASDLVPRWGAPPQL